MSLHSSPAPSLSCRHGRGRPAAAPALLCLSFLCLSFFCLGRAAGANTLTVPAQFATIQAALNASVSGDTVLISDGFYTGPGNVDIDFGGRDVTVTSVRGATHTIIDCQGSSRASHRGFTLHGGETAAVISGLTIEYGYEDVNSAGGGILASNVGLTVQDCVLKGSQAGSGGGIYNGNAGSNTIQVIRCTFEGNAAAGDGGGIMNANGGSGTITMADCVLEGNTAGTDGGGIVNVNENVGTSTITVTNCALTANTAANYAGGILNFNESGNGTPDTILVTNCTLTANTAQANGTAGIGGGLFNFSTGSSVVILTNDVLYGDAGGEIVTGGGAVSATHCDVEGGYAGTGNVNADPQFVSPGDLHLRHGSPCLGAGTHTGAPALTLDGRMRPNPPSIGAYEAPPTATALNIASASTVYYQTRTLKAFLTAGAAVLAGKTVTFKADGLTVGTAVTATNGVAYETFTNAGRLAAGGHTLTASFAGDASDAASLGTGTLTVTKASATVTVPNVTGTHGTTATLSGTLKRTADGALMANRTLTFKVDGASVGTAVTNASGVASKSYAIPAGAAAGAHTVTATFPAEANYSAASGTGTLTVN